MLTILDRYILSEFLRKWVTLLCLILVIMLLKDLLGELARLMTKEKATALAVIRLFIYRQPGPVVQMLPLSVILAMMFSVGSLAKKKEILAIHACGVSYLRLALPLAVVSALIAIGSFICGETIVPECMARAQYIKEVTIGGKAATTLTEDKGVTQKGRGERFYNLVSFDSEAQKMELPIITDVGKTPEGREIVRRRIDARSAELPQNAEAKAKNLWRFYDVIVREFDENEKMTNLEETPQKDFVMEGNLDQILVTNKKGQDMGFFELRSFVQARKDLTVGSYSLRLETEMHTRLAFPFAVFLLSMLGYTFAVRSNIRSMVAEFGMALACMLVWYVLYSSASKVGRYDVLPPFLAAWYGNFLFIGLTAWRFWNLEQVPKK